MGSPLNNLYWCAPNLNAKLAGIIQAIERLQAKVATLPTDSVSKSYVAEQIDNEDFLIKKWVSAQDFATSANVENAIEKEDSEIKNWVFSQSYSTKENTEAVRTELANSIETKVNSLEDWILQQNFATHEYVDSLVGNVEAALEALQ